LLPGTGASVSVLFVSVTSAVLAPDVDAVMVSAALASVLTCANDVPVFCGVCCDGGLLLHLARISKALVISVGYLLSPNVRDCYKSLQMGEYVLGSTERSRIIALCLFIVRFSIFMSVLPSLGSISIRPGCRATTACNISAVLTTDLNRL